MFRITNAFLLLVLSAANTGLAQDTREDEDTIYPEDESIPTVKCIRPKMIKATEVIDDRNILFYMRDDKIYRNVLPRKCTNLDRYGTFSYPSTYGRLCNVDRIVMMGGGLSQGTRCRLGKFYPISVQEMDAIRLEARRIEELGVDDVGKEKE